MSNISDYRITLCHSVPSAALASITGSYNRSKATNDLENYDQKRHEEFKRYEMMKEHERKEHLKNLDEEHRKDEEQHYEELRKKHADHPKINHPGSQDQLKEVWKESDGLDPNDFDPKTFFKLHDTNGDSYIDEQELEALFTKELEKMYRPNLDEDDMTEMEEERLRMREHVMNEVDTNKDRLVSLEEFLMSTNKKEFFEPDSWETLEQAPAYTDEEMKLFEEQLAQEESNLNRKNSDLQKQKEELERQQEKLNAQKAELQQAVEHMQIIKLEKANAAIEVKDGGATVAVPPGGQALPVLPGDTLPLPPGHQQHLPARS